jgi:hypothetical protein
MCDPKMTGVRYSLGRAVPSLSKLESWLTIKYAVIVIPHLNTWLKDAAPLDVAWKKRVAMLIQKLVDIFAAYPGCLKATRGPATIGELDLVM